MIAKLLIISIVTLNTLLLNANYSSANKINSNSNINKNAKHISENNLQLDYINSRNAKSVNDDACQLNIQCNHNSDMSSIKLPIIGPKGDQGPPGPIGIKGAKGEQGLNGIPARELPLPNFSAFFATLVNNTGPYLQDKDIAFTNIVTNYGNNYDAESGIYTAPYSGTYQFIITVSATGRQKAGVYLMRNKHAVLTVWAESEPWSTSSQTAILRLDLNDRVYLRLQSRASHLHGYGYSSFGGSLLYEDLQLN